MRNKHENHFAYLFNLGELNDVSNFNHTELLDDTLGA